MVNVRIRKFLVVVDNTTECHSAINYASQRAVRTGRKLTLLRVIDPSDFHHWLGVGKLMKQEAETEASIINLIKEDKAISLLVLAAGTELNNPGPLVSNFTGTKSGIFPIPITIVPGHLSEKTIIELT
jgi:nucleotide-binding universal stress UspA family protein